MKKTRLKVTALVMSTIMTLTLVMTSKTKVSWANEPEATKKHLKNELVKQIESSINSGDKFSGTEGLDINVENEPLEKVGNPEEKIRVIVELVDRPATLQMPDGVQPSEELINEVKEAQLPIQIMAEAETGEEIRHTYGNLINGFSMDIKRKDIEKVREIEGVVSVKEARVYYPDMNSAKELTQALQVWQDYGYKGEGLVVSIVDTGIDYTHKDMKLTNTSKAKLNKDNTNKGDGKFYTDKVPYGYNFADENDEVIDTTGSMHGMHVAGIVAANASDEEVATNEGIKGVAPEAQLLAMKVFTNNPNIPYAYSDDIIAALESSVELSADVINMSLGSTAGYRDAEDPEQTAIKNATDDGVICVVSAGNSATSTNPYIIEEVSDIATVGSPGLAADALQVASYENPTISLPAFQFDLQGAITKVGFTQCDVDPVDIFKSTDELELVDCGFGNIADFKDKDLSGKVALISRGQIAFVDKQINAQAAGAIAVIIYNNAPGYINMASDPSIKIPALFITQADGNKIKSGIANGGKISFKNDVINAPNAEAGKMSSFSSWGPAPNLEFAPQITGPGGNIYSTLNNNKYGTKSGTSMSSPHVAGATALIIQGLKDSGIKLEGRELVEFVKKSIINTAKVLTETNAFGEKDIPYSPRRQGSGMIQTKNAINNRVLATGEDGQATISLKEIGDTTEFTLNLTNYSDKEEKYTVDSLGGVLTAFTPSMANKEVINGLMAFDTVLDGATLNFDKTEVIVPANGQATVTATLNIPTGAVSNNFVEGFIKLNSVNEKTPSLVVPYMGFYGDWSNQSIIDGTIWDNDAMISSSFAATKVLGNYNYLGYVGRDENNNVIIDKNLISISPNGDELGDSFIPALYLLRNAKDIKVDLLDRDKNIVATDIAGDSEFRKKVISSTGGLNPSILENISWNGMIYDKKQGTEVVVEEGQYYLNYKAKVDGDGSKYQDFIMPVNVDLTPVKTTMISPSVTDNTKYTLELTFNNELKNGTVNNILVSLNGEEATNVAVDKNNDKATVELTLNNNAINKIEVATVDNAYNIGVDSFEVTVGNIAAEVKLTNFPDAQYVTDNELLVTGVYSGAIGEILVNGQAPDTMENGVFTKKITLVEGPNTVKLYATNVNGDVITNYGHKVFCDTVAPELNLTSPILNSDNIVITSKDSITLKGSVSDNTEGYKLWLNGEVKLSVALSGAEGETTYREFEYEVPVEDGDIITLKAVDLVGHETIKQFAIKVDKTAPVINITGVENGKQYNTNIKPVITVEPIDATVSATLNGETYNGEEITADGSYALAVKAIGINGIETLTTVNFVIDKINPVVNITGVEDGKAYNTNVTPIVTVQDGVEYTAMLNETPYTTSTLHEDGSYVLKVKATDKAGNVTEKVVAFEIDKIAPKVEVKGVIDGMKYDKEVKVDVVVEDGATVVTTLNGKPYSGSVIKENGNYILKAVATDKAGNVTEEVVEFSIKLPEGPGGNPTPTPTPDKPKPGVDGDKVTDGNSNGGKGSISSGKLPSTGGTNTTYIVVIGVILVIAGGFIVYRKKKNNNQDK